VARSRGKIGKSSITIADEDASPGTVIRPRAISVPMESERGLVAGYFVGGATSTAEKVVKGKYARGRVITTLTAIYPADKPRYPKPPTAKDTRTIK
jgi:hypothetical protein